MSLNIAVAYHKRDRDQFIRWMNHVNELGGLGTHKLYTIHAFDCEPAPDIIPSVKLTDADKIIGDWQSSSPARSAAAPNSMFRTFAWYFYLQKLGPWMFCEPDCIPLKKGWLDTLEAEYIRGGKPFMGAHVKIDRVPEHMSGNAIYPQNVPEVGGRILFPTMWVNDAANGQAFELAFDVAGATDTLKQAHFTNLIQHRFRHPGFKNRAELDALIDPQAVVFHSNKDGSIYQFLGGAQKVDNGSQPESGEAPVIPVSVDPTAQEPQPAGAAPIDPEVMSHCPYCRCTTHKHSPETFPIETRRLAEQLAELADNQYHRRKVRDALKKVGLL